MAFKKNTKNMYIGNTFTIQDGVGTVSKIKYVLVKKGRDYVAIPGNFKVLVGSYELTIDDEGIPFLINGVRLDKKVGKKRLSTKQITQILVENNDIKELKKCCKN